MPTSNILSKVNRAHDLSGVVLPSELKHLSLLRTPTTRDASPDIATFVGVVPHDGVRFQANDLLWYGYDWDNDYKKPFDKHWLNGTGNAIGTKWDVFRLITGRNRRLYGVDPAGKLHLYTYNGSGASVPSGLADWSGPYGIDGDYGKYVLLTCGQDITFGLEVFFGVTKTGELHRIVATGGLAEVKAIGSGFDAYDKIFASDGDVLFARKPSGELYLFKGQQRFTDNWEFHSAEYLEVGKGVQIGKGWQRFAHLLAFYGRGGHEIYAAESKGLMYRYLYKGDGTKPDPNGNLSWDETRQIRLSW